MIRLKTKDDILRIRDASVILCEALQELQKMTTPGVTTGELDGCARDIIETRGAKPSFLGYMDYPSSVCISINDEVIHGIPGKRKLQEGDLVGIDLGVNLKGYYSDAAVTVGVGRVPEKKMRLIRVTEECLQEGIRNTSVGNRIRDISSNIFSHADQNGYGVVRQYCGHGVGFSPHEEPQVPNYIFSGPNPRLKSGMVIALEPMINEGTWEVKVLEDGWTVVTADRKCSAHAEHTVALIDDMTFVLTAIDSQTLAL